MMTSKRKWKLIISLAAIVVLCAIVFFIPVWKIKESKIPEVSVTPLQEGTEIKKDAGKVKIAESDTKELFLQTDTMVFEIKDKKTGTSFLTGVKNSNSGSELALLSLSYLGDDNNLYEWNSYDNCTLFSAYELYQIENGVRIDLRMNEGESNRFYEYLPKKMSIEQFETMFKGGIESLKKEGTLEEAKADRYLRTLSLVYKKSVMEECYSVTYTGSPPVNAVNQMIEIAKLVGYDQDMLLADADTFGFTVTFSEAASFLLSVEVLLEEEELVALVNTENAVSENDYYAIQNIKLLPNLGGVESSEYEEGSILVPDGAGALFDFNSYRGNVKEYVRPIYDNDFFKDYAYMPEYGEELFMPIFGMMYGPMDNTQKGFLGIVEEGAESGYIHTKLASNGTDSSKYNKVFASFDADQYHKVKINGEYSESSASYMVSTGMQKVDFKVRYHFFDKKVTYFDMAKYYQGYLMETEGIERTFTEGKAKVYLEAIGALSIQEKIIGIPYNSVISMTTYEELLNILKDLNQVDVMVQYDGFFNNGMNNHIQNKASRVSENGSNKSFKELETYLAEENISFYPAVSLTRVGETGKGFLASSHAIRDFSNEEIKLYRYMPALGILSGALYDGVKHNGYYLLSPRWLDSVTSDFAKKSSQYPSLAVTDLAGMYYADYRFKEMISGTEGNLILENNLAKLSQDKTLALTNPHINKIGYGEVAVDISRESSDYVTFSQTIPFKQLVMNGLIEYTTETINLSSKNLTNYVLQVAELGAYPKFLITNDSVDGLKESDYSYLYSVQYSLWADKIKEMYLECEEIRNIIGTNEIVNHRMLQDNVYSTEYASKVEVIVNYNLFEVKLSDGTLIAPESYYIKEANTNEK